jgi:hypothetical protein
MIGLPYEKEGTRLQYICVKIESLGKEKMKHLEFLKNWLAVTCRDMGDSKSEEQRVKNKNVHNGLQRILKLS